MSFPILMMIMVALIFEGCTENNANYIPETTAEKNDTIQNATPITIEHEEEEKNMIGLYGNISGSGSHSNRRPKWVQIIVKADTHMTIAPSTSPFVAPGKTFSFTLTPNEGYKILLSAAGTCPLGSFNGNTYTTGVLTHNCEVIFATQPYIFAYVTPGISATSIDKFLLASDGLLSSYTSATLANGSQSFGQMTFASVNGIQYAYILDPNGAVYWCSINAEGNFSNCTTTASLPSLNSWQARGIAFATFNAQYAYILDPGNNVIFQCAVDIIGNFSSCQQFSSLPILAPYGIAFTTDTNATQHAYITDAGSGSGFGDVLICSMQNDGSFNTCTQSPSSGAPDWIPVAIAFTTVNGTQYAYVADNGANTPGHVYRCSLNSDGSFVNSGCIQTPANDSSLTNWYPYYVAFKTINGTKYAYVVNSSGSIIGNLYRCLVDYNGLFTDCELTPELLPSPWQPSGIAFR